MKKHLVFLLPLLLTSLTAVPQTKAVTETGEEVILYDNGTWEYANKELAVNKDIPVNPTPFTKSDGATFLLKSKVIPKGFWLDPKKWSFEKGSDSSDEEYQLQLRDGDLYAIIITEQVELTLDALRKIVVDNAREAAADLRILQKEYRTVNGEKVLMMKMTGTVNGIKVGYLGYYHSYPSGTVQYLTYTTQNLLEKYQDTMETLLNGMVKL